MLQSLNTYQFWIKLYCSNHHTIGQHGNTPTGYDGRSHVRTILVLFLYYIFLYIFWIILIFLYSYLFAYQIQCFPFILLIGIQARYRTGHARSIYTATTRQSVSFVIKHFIMKKTFILSIYYINIAGNSSNKPNINEFLNI